jgi:hypothetical protein
MASMGVVLVSLGLSLVAFVGCTAMVWLAATQPTRRVVVGFAAAAVVDVAGIVTATAGYPWTDLVVVSVGVGGGLVLGRVVSIRRVWPFAVVLILLSVADTVQVVLTSAGPAPAPPSTGVPPGQLYLNLLVALPGGHRFLLGVFDLWLVTAMAEYWRRRGGSFGLAAAPGTVGISVEFMGVVLRGLASLPLIPFLTVGWFTTLLVRRLRRVSPLRSPGG